MIDYGIGQSAGKAGNVTRDQFGGLIVGEGSFALIVKTRGKEQGYKRPVQFWPCFALGMMDVEAIDEACELLRANEIPHHVHLRKNGMKYIQIVGMKRLESFIPWILPHLFGNKFNAAKHLSGYIDYRLSLKKHDPLTEIDIGALEKMRSFNTTRSGRSIADVRRILRDYMPDSLKGEDIVRAA